MDVRKADIMIALVKKVQAEAEHDQDANPAQPAHPQQEGGRMDDADRDDHEGNDEPDNEDDVVMDGHTGDGENIVQSEGEVRNDDLGNGLGQAG